MGEYQSTRDEHVLPMFEFTCQLATLEPPPPEMQQLLGAVYGNQEAMDGFARERGSHVARRVPLRGERRAHLRGGRLNPARRAVPPGHRPFDPLTCRGSGLTLAIPRKVAVSTL